MHDTNIVLGTGYSFHSAACKSSEDKYNEPSVKGCKFHTALLQSFLYSNHDGGAAACLLGLHEEPEQNLFMKN